MQHNWFRKTICAIAAAAAVALLVVPASGAGRRSLPAPGITASQDHDQIEWDYIQWWDYAGTYSVRVRFWDPGYSPSAWGDLNGNPVTEEIASGSPTTMNSVEDPYSMNYHVSYVIGTLYQPSQMAVTYEYLNWNTKTDGTPLTAYSGFLSRVY